VFCSVLWCVGAERVNHSKETGSQCVEDVVFCSVLRCVAVFCGVSSGPTAEASIAGAVLECVGVCCSALQCVAVCCRVLECVERPVEEARFAGAVFIVPRVHLVVERDNIIKQHFICRQRFVRTCKHLQYVLCVHVSVRCV